MTNLVPDYKLQREYSIRSLGSANRKAPRNWLPKKLHSRAPPAKIAARGFFEAGQDLDDLPFLGATHHHPNHDPRDGRRRGGELKRSIHLLTSSFKVRSTQEIIATVASFQPPEPRPFLLRRSRRTPRPCPHQSRPLPYASTANLLSSSPTRPFGRKTSGLSKIIGHDPATLVK